jgi:hypothetical protein
MAYAVKWYGTPGGYAVPASQTDQAGKRGVSDHERTYAGRPAVYAGSWYGIQMRYGPFRLACKEACDAAAALEATGETPCS